MIGLNQKLYPEGIDCTWIACDPNGHVAVFISAGEGPIPSRALTSSPVPVDELEVRLLRLQCTSDAELLFTAPRPDSYVELARRGMYVYDWTDIHRTSDVRCAYEIVARPTRPVGLAGLSADLAACARSTKFSSLLFMSSNLVDPTAYFPCMHAHSGD